MKTNLMLVIMLLALLLSSCGQPAATPTLTEVAPIPTATTEPTLQSTNSPTLTAVANEEYLHNFQVVWQTVNDTYFDPTFGGLDWKALHGHYRPLIATAQDDAVFYRLVNEMIWELDVSHGFVAPPDDMLRILPETLASGSTGTDVRLLDGEAVILSIAPGSPAEEAGLRPGYLIRSIDGHSIEQIVAEEQEYLAPPYNSRARIQYVLRQIWGRIYGPPETSVPVTYSDENGEIHSVNLLRKARDRKSTLLEFFLPQFLEFESKRLPNDIGYIRFNTFHPDLINDFASAVRDLHDAHGLIIDLRGNAGGDADVLTQMAGQLVPEQTLLFTSRTRHAVIDFTLRPEKSVFEGTVAILIDATCISASELFPGVLQEIGRAVIVGEPTPGLVTGGSIATLPNGAFFMYPSFHITTSQGTVLEGQGVAPDIEVKLDRTLLLRGIDSQLAAAIEYIERGTSKE